VASPALGKQPSAVKESANSIEGTPVDSRHHWGKLDTPILGQLYEALIVTDSEGNITGGNRATLVTYGYGSEELLGVSISVLCTEDEKSVLQRAVASVKESGHYETELRTRTKLGADVFAHLSLTSLVDSNSTPAGMVAIFTNITERKLLDAALKQSHAKQQKMGDVPEQPPRMKSDLVQRQINGAPFLIASPIMHKFMTMVERVAAHSEIVLITGETGSGKELIARSIHDNSPRRSQPWVDINCAALPEHLVESELFGYEKGAFSGAESAKLGLFELADHGTLFLDEIGELDLKLQVKLLRVLDGAPYYRLGGHRKIKVDVRIVAATNQDLEAAVEEGRFRRDLFHRLSQFQLRVPPLRERPEDVMALAQHFLALKDEKLRLTAEGLSALACYKWPGNVRELRNLMAKLVMGAASGEISSADLLAEISVSRERKSQTALQMTNLEGMEEQMIIRALENTGGHRALAAEQLGISRRTLSRKLREYNITCPEGERGRSLGTLGSDQQKIFRAKTRLLVNLKNNQGDEINVTAVNLSGGGLGVDGFTSPQRFAGLLECSFILPETETLIQAKVRVVWADAIGRAGIRFVVLEPLLYEEIHHWTARKMKEEGWELPQESRNNLSQ
jgi:PAS domain S-box-containing protein